MCSDRLLQLQPAVYEIKLFIMLLAEHDLLSILCIAISPSEDRRSPACSTTSDAPCSMSPTGAFAAAGAVSAAA